MSEKKRLAEIAALLPELQRWREEGVSIEQRLAQAVGIDTSTHHKPKKKTLSNDEFISACECAGARNERISTKRW